MKRGMFLVVNMSKGNVGKLLLSFSLPMLISNCFQQMYNMADSIVAGKYAGLTALAAVGASYPITMIFIAVASGFSIGATVIISRFFGAEEFSKMKTAIFTAVTSALGIALVFTAVGVGFSDKMLEILKTDAAIMADSAVYLDIYCWGLVFLFLYNIVTGIFTAMGDSKTPLVFLIVSSVSNIIFDVIFVRNLSMGVAGVAWATFLCQAVCSLGASFVLYIRLRHMTLGVKFRIFSFSMLKTISHIAIPSILQQSFVSVGNLFIQGIINSFGYAATGGYSAAIKLNTLAISSFSTMSSSISSFTSQNVGAKKYSRIKEGFRYGAIIVCCTATVFTLVFLIFNRSLISIFLENTADESAEALKIGMRFLLICSPFYPFICLKLTADGVLRGTGNMSGFMFATFLDLILRVVLAFVLSKPFGTDGIWFSWPIGWVSATVASLILYKTGKWRKMTDSE